MLQLKIIIQNRAEEYSLAYQLKLKDTIVRPILEKLTMHGILKKKEDYRKLTFFEKYAEKLGMDYNKAMSLSNNAKVQIYCFHKDLMFIIKARIHQLKIKADERMRSSRQTGQSYRCNNTPCFQSRPGNEVRELEARSYDFKCRMCQNPLIRVIQENELNEEESKECQLLINDLEDEFKQFQQYKVPPHFFGFGIQQIDYVNMNGSGFTESIDDVEFKINVKQQDDVKQKYYREALQQLVLEQPRLVNFYKEYCTRIIEEPQQPIAGKKPNKRRKLQ
ncbi:UNKNOWN [Stylonychia lemnae]|uniref:Uncharacterized protein n=1 Tax=Stylonychia lemnae TaxID=5949 RepID=A0A078AS74_STYLE|nr:UNKNOWN [Stylonychia lemnae]|eukprot:CDW84816.1 UNKNOWN [Stylonychia lemnae]